MGYLDLPSENYEDFVFTVDGIGIEQNGETVADATYGFYKYMHFDGTYNNEVKVTVQHTQEAVDNADVDAEGNKLDIFGNVIDTSNNTSEVSGVTRTESGEAGGIGIKYWLQSLNIRDGKQLRLNGLTDDDDADAVIADNYTLSAELTGKGGIENSCRKYDDRW